MKRIYVIFVVIILVVIFTIYNGLNLSLNAQVTPRKALKSPIEGDWIVDKSILIGDKNLSNEDANRYLGKTASFSNKIIFFNFEVCTSPSYKVKLVKAYNYLWDNFKVNPKTIGINEEYVQVITISSKDKYFDEYIKINDTSIAKQSGDMLLFFKKSGDSSESPSEILQKSIDYRKISSANEKETKSKSGLLLALRDSKSNYRTIWISYINKSFMPVTEVKDILLPRMNGFWRIGADNTLWAYPLKNDLNKETYNNMRKIEKGYKILFIGHDHISIENDKKELQVLLIDNLSGESVKLSQSFGLGYSNSTLQGENNKSQLAKNLDETSWGVFRRSGRWILRGRTNIEEKNSYRDFDISFATPKNLIKYDDLYPSFSEIKTKIPQAVDAYSSPNRDFVVVLTEEELLVVPINEGKLGNIVEKVTLKKGESSVMAHWATGYYVDEWNKKVKTCDDKPGNAVDKLRPKSEEVTLTENWTAGYYIDEWTKKSK